MKNMKLYAKPFMWFSALLVTALLTACGGGDQGRDPILGVPSAPLTTITVTPLNAAAPIGGKQQFIATATYADGATLDVTTSSVWSSSAVPIATIGSATGIATGVTSGTSIINATYGGKSGSVVFTVTAPVLVSIAVTPINAAAPIGGTQQFIATATYADGASRDVTTSSVWSSSAVTIATIGSATGIATGVTSGTSTINANYGGKANSVVFTVSPPVLMSISVLPNNPSIAIGNKQQFTAMGTFSNGSSSDISAISTFTSASTSVATILTSGLASGVSVGTSVITASSGTKTGTTTLTVTPATLLSIALTPANPILQIAATRDLVVTATFSDATTTIVTSNSTYVSATPTAVSVSNAGVLTGVAAGSSLITAAYNGKSASTTATVNAVTLSSIAIAPLNTSINVGSTQQYSATATYSDTTTGDVTNTVNWTSGSTNIATIVQSGKASGLAAGVTIITATQGTKSASTNLTVTAPVITGINLGAAASFGVLAGTSITNNSGGLTMVTGDVGSPSQTVDPVQTAGYNNYKSGAILANALADLQVAIDDANSRTCDVSLASGIDLGGLTFGPGVYCYAGAISITGTFTMNGPGVYIFRTSSTIDTTANSIVALNGGATAGNTFWVPVAATTLGANSVFKGTIMASSGAITMGDTATLQNGRVLTRTAATLKNNVISK